MHLVRQALQAPHHGTLHPLVPRLAADPESAAQPRHGSMARGQPLLNQFLAIAHRRYVVPVQLGKVACQLRSYRLMRSGCRQSRMRAEYWWSLSADQVWRLGLR